MLYQCLNKPNIWCTYSHCPVDIMFQLIGEVRKNVLTPASLDTCAAPTAAASLSGDSDNAATAKPVGSTASTYSKLHVNACTHKQPYICHQAFGMRVPTTILVNWLYQFA